MQLKLDVLDIVTGVRPAARIILEKNSEVHHCIPILLELDLSIRVGGTCLMKKSPTNFVDHYVNINDNETPEFVILYISKEKNLSHEASEADAFVRDADLGKILGYPDCCIEFVIKRGSVPSIEESFSLYSSNSSYNPLSWPVAHLFDAGLVPHFPCSMQCKRTHSLTQARLVVLRDEIQDCRHIDKIIHFNSILYPKKIQQINDGSYKKSLSHKLLAPIVNLKELVDDIQ